MRPLLENFIYIKKLNVVFVYVPKVACTNWKCILRYLSEQNDYLNPALAHDRKRSGLTYVSDLPEKEDILNSSNAKKYSFVRNPYSRALSAYRNKIEPFDIGSRSMIDQDFWSKTYQEIRAEVKEMFDSDYVDFLHFLKWLKCSDHFMVNNEHWLPQSDILGEDRVKYDFIGRMENMPMDSDYLLNLLACDLKFPSQADVSFPGTNSSNQLDEYYSYEAKQLVNELYERDFINFNYKMDKQCRTQ